MNAARRRTGRGVALLAWLLLFACFASAHAAAPAGQVIVAVGEVVAIKEGAEPRALQRRSQFYEGEVVETAPGARAQLRFEDGAILSLREDSALRIDEYQFANHGGAGDKAFMTLLKGGFRTITGAIGKSDPSAYKVTTAVATIGVRGTHYWLQLIPQVEDVELLLGVMQGAIDVSNQGGTMRLGAGASFDFARVVSPQRRPTGLLQPPPQSQPRESAPVQPPAAPAEDEGSSDGDEAGEGGDGEESTGDSGIDEFAGGDSSTSSSTSTSADSSGTAAAPTTSTTAATTTTSTTSTNVAEVTNPVSAVPTGDLRLTSTESAALDAHIQAREVAIMLKAAPDVGEHMFGGSYAASDRPGDAGDKFFAVSPEKPTGAVPESFTQPAKGIARLGSATARDATYLGTNNSGYTVGNVQAMGVDWGKWEGGTFIYNDPADGSAYHTDTSQLYWMTMSAADPSEISGLSGYLDYGDRLLLGHMIASDGTDYPIDGTMSSMTVRVVFDDLAISSGTITLRDAGYSVGWNVSLSGASIQGNFVEFKIDSGSSNFFDPSNSGNVRSDIGGVSGVFISPGGATGEGIGGMLRLVGDQGQAEAFGIFVLGQ